MRHLFYQSKCAFMLPVALDRRSPFSIPFGFWRDQDFYPELFSQFGKARELMRFRRNK